MEAKKRFGRRGDDVQPKKPMNANKQKPLDGDNKADLVIHWNTSPHNIYTALAK